MTTTETRHPMEEGTSRGPNHVKMADVVVSTFRQDTMAAHASPQPSPHINLPPPPNPPFTFPSRLSSSAPSSLSRSTGRRHQSAIEISPRSIGLEAEQAEPHRQPAALPTFSFNPGNTLSPESAHRRPRPPALPDFSFNPGATNSQTDAALLSPSQTPTSPRTVPSHIGHRRGGSEFVGGKLTSGESITVMGTSTTGSEGSFASPTLAPSNGARRHQRGHSHRRSGAISSHDLTLILQPPKSPSRGSSAPASPADSRENHARPDFDNEKMVGTAVTSRKEIFDGEGVAPENGNQPTELSPKLNARARVGFSDTLEFIPRPLSLVSTDTTSTVRPGHSVSGSISSIVSIANSANTERDTHATLGSPVPRSSSGSRPSTAGAVLERSSSIHLASTEDAPVLKRRNSIPVLSEQAQADSNSPSLTTPTKNPKRWSFFGFDSFATAGSPTRLRPASASSSDTAMRDCPEITPSDDHDNARVVEACVEASPVVEKKKSSKKKQKRVKTWAGSILTRKSKARAPKSKGRRRSQTPPITRTAREDNVDAEPVAQDDQPIKIQFKDSPTRSAPDLQPSKHRSVRSEDDMSFPMIDLDAALGPFNTPTRDPQWEEAQRAGAPQKRQLHSAAGMRGFSGPGMFYHRRAESAPEMPPFEGGRFSIHRFGSSATMADVFEEDEEDEEEDSHTGDSAEDSTSESQGTTTGDEEEEGNDIDDTTSTPTQEYGAELVSPTIDASIGPSSKRKQSGSSLDLPPPAMVRNEASSSSLHSEVIMEEDSSLFPARRDAARRDLTFGYSLDTPVFGGPSQRREAERKEQTPPDATSIILPGLPTMPISPYPISHSSSFPSPRSPVSYDAHRISTTPSSIADEHNFRSLLMGEPGPEVVRLSIDVPSLTSTNSTMTRESSFFPGVRPRNMPFHDQRPASFTSTAFGRRRSSLASLSRLISSAHGERSKLSMEVPFENEVEKKAKPSKSKRLTKMMQFWKSSKASSDSRE